MCLISARASGDTAPNAAVETPGQVLAGLADPNFELMGAKDGLPHDSVYGFAQDTRGLLWIGTFGGLSRFDGYRLRTYVHDAHDPSSLPDNNIRGILPAENGGLWIATGNAAVIRYDAATDSFQKLPNLPKSLAQSRIFCMASDGDGGVWFGSQIGLAHYSPKDNAFEVFGKAAGPTGSKGFGQGSVFSILRDSHGDLWVGGDHGLMVRRSGSVRFEPVPGLDGEGQIGTAPPVWTIFEDGEGRLWVGSDKSGVGILNRATGHVEGVKGLAGAGSLIGTATVRGIVEIRKDEFWIATYGSGLVTWDMAAMRGRRVMRDLTAAAPLSNNFMRTIFLDRTGLVWLGTDRGLSKINSVADGLLTIHSSPLREKGLQGNEVRGVSAQGDRLWVGFDQGGFAVIEPNGTIRNIKPAAGVKPEDQSLREVLAIKATADDTVYAAGQGLYEIDSRKLTYRPVPDPLLKKQVVNALLVDGEDVWVATYNGLVRHNRRLKTSQMFGHIVGDAGSLSDNYVRDMVKTRDGKLWITTRLGLDCFDYGTGKFAHVRHDPKDPESLPNDNIQPITEDLNGRLWIGTIGGGLTVLWGYDAQGKARFKTLTKQNGLPNDIVLTVMRGKDGRIWSNTPGGLAVVDPQTLKVRTYTAADGLRTSSQNLFSSATMRDGTIVFPGDQGLIVVRPELLTETMPSPALVLTDVEAPGARSGAGVAAEALSRGIVLPGGAKAFEASFALLDYTGPNAVRYSYVLGGFDRGWSTSSVDRRTAAYTNLPAGRYTLRVRAVARDGVADAVEIAVPVVVNPAWSESWWFKLLCMLGIVGLVLLAIRLRTEVARKRQRELEAEVAMRTAELANKQQELLDANELLIELATRDPLTGIFNRRQFLENAKDELERTKRIGSPLTLLLIDADHFKAVNDRYGHRAGDEVLKTLVDELSGQLRRHDIIARYGGEELVVLLSDTDLVQGVALAERLRTHVASEPVEFEGSRIPVTISIGVALAQETEDVDAVLARADAALYAAKSGGRNKVVTATEEVMRRQSRSVKAAQKADHAER